MEQHARSFWAGRWAEPKEGEIILDLGGVSGDVSGAVCLNKKEARPGIIADLERPLPVRSSSVDTVHCHSTLEHLFHAREAAREIHRILKPGGRAYISVPFLYQVHPSPHDFHRYTGEALNEMLRDFGDVRISVIGGLFTVVIGLLNTNLFHWRGLDRLGPAMDRMVNRIKGRDYRTFFPLEYLVVARK